MKPPSVASPLRQPEFQRLWLGLSVSYLGDQFTIIALLWFVLQLTGSGAAVGLVIFCFGLPGVFTGTILGRLLDRYQPRLVIGFDNLARAALIAAIPTIYALGCLQLWHVFVLALLAGALSPATTAGVRAFLPHLVDNAALDRANALTATSLQFSYLAGPVAAGFAVARLGGPWALFIDAGSFLLMGLLALTLPTIRREPRVIRHAAVNRWLGFGALFSLRYVPALTLLSLVFFFSYGPLEAALPVYSRQTLHASAGGYGLLWTGFGIGAFAGVLTLTKLSRRWQPSIALPMIAVLWGALLLPLFFIRQLPLAMLFLGVAGASWAPYTPMETTLLQRLVPPEIRGQVFGARHSLVAAAAPLGAAFGGLLLQYLSAPLVIAVSGLACILAGLGGLVSPSLRQLQTRRVFGTEEQAHWQRHAD
ncbi:MAG TPA: MFS transporter [Myxococcaceae bacterium]|nr:MFS transporter [Myxococcaceae bacterium]